MPQVTTVIVAHLIVSRTLVEERSLLRPRIGQRSVLVIIAIVITARRRHGQGRQCGQRHGGRRMPKGRGRLGGLRAKRRLEQRGRVGIARRRRTPQVHNGASDVGHRLATAIDIATAPFGVDMSAATGIDTADYRESPECTSVLLVAIVSAAAAAAAAAADRARRIVHIVRIVAAASIGVGARIIAPNAKQQTATERRRGAHRAGGRGARVESNGATRVGGRYAHAALPALSAAMLMAGENRDIDVESESASDAENERWRKVQIEIDSGRDMERVENHISNRLTLSDAKQVK